jgi:parallel beta-helix repeat protein
VFGNNTKHGLHLFENSGAVVVNILCHNNIHGVYLNKSNNNTLTGVVCSNNARGLVLWDGCLNNAVSGLVTETNEYGVLFGDSANTIISGWNSKDDTYRYCVAYNNARNRITGAVFGAANNKAYDELSPPTQPSDWFNVQFIGE